MTTNNPPIAAWAPSTALAKLASRHNNAPCVLTDGPAEFNDVPLVRLSDYEALQADRDQQYDMKVKAREQRDAVTAKLKALQAECEKLRRRARAAEREYSKVARTLKGLERVSKVVSDHSDEVCTENNQLRVECKKLRKDAETERAIQRAAEVLPHGFRIEIEIEKDSGGVALFSPGAIVECDFHGGLAEQIAGAIDAAMQEENK